MPKLRWDDCYNPLGRIISPARIYHFLPSSVVIMMTSSQFLSLWCHNQEYFKGLKRLLLIPSHSSSLQYLRIARHSQRGAWQHKGCFLWLGWVAFSPITKPAWISLGSDPAPALPGGHKDACWGATKKSNRSVSMSVNKHFRVNQTSQLWKRIHYLYQGCCIFKAALIDF